jgi:hypothetical protein
MDTISSLWSKICSHPDYVGGTVFTRFDVARVLSGEFESVEQEDAAAAAVTDEQLAIAQNFSDNYFFDRYLWFDLLRAEFDRQSGGSIS